MTTTTTTTDWAIPQQAKLKYTQLFNLHDRSRSGFLSGLQCRDILLQSGLTRNVLAEIWNLSDIDGDGQLTREEFILAMHLTNQVRSGLSLPSELPPDLVPPSYRRTRSISATSVHSANSANSSASIGGINNNQTTQISTDIPAGTFASSGSVLNTNSFEDKRRENFEKGRAELERRRLKIVEQQSSLLNEQLAACKKQVAEAKAKIDAMRSKRDTKAGTITSLEAQLKTVRDKQAYLNHEEASLIAIAKDLNLVDSTQAELDLAATKAKQESIKLMKEKLAQIQQEKESKAKELQDSKTRLEESRAELKSISEVVNKTYENYKEKVANAKVARAQFIEENKSTTFDLDSVWDSAPTYNTNIINNNNDINTIDQLSTRLESTNLGAKDDPWNSEPSTNQLSAFTPPASSFSEVRDYSALSNLSSKFGNDEKAGDKQLSDSGSSSSNKKRYRALYGFEARNHDELTINPGDTIIGSEVICEPGWLSGELNGRTGLFPEAYVEALPDVSQNITNDSTAQNTTSIGSMWPANETSNISLKETSSSATTAVSTAIPANKYKVVYAFGARNPDELTINPGDIITGVDGLHEPGWLMGELNGQKGLFPEAYVERTSEVAQEQHSDQPGKSRSKRAEVATVIANYRALGQEQLNLEKGQLVLIRRKMDSGWWEGEIQVKGKKKQYGWFPSSYVKLLSNTGGAGVGTGTSTNPLQ